MVSHQFLCENAGFIQDGEDVLEVQPPNRKPT